MEFSIDVAHMEGCSSFGYGKYNCSKTSNLHPAGLPDGVFNVLTGKGSFGSALAQHPDVDKE